MTGSMLAKPLTGPSPFGAATERLSVLKSLQASRASYTLATSFEGMYGENRVSCIAFLTQVLKKHFFLSESSVFLDIGSGRGLPVAVVALLAGVRASLGIELDETAYHLSLQMLLELQSIMLQRRLYNYQNPFHPSADCPIAFSCSDAVQLTSLDPVTHVFSFDLAMPAFMIDRHYILHRRTLLRLQHFLRRKPLLFLFCCAANRTYILSAQSFRDEALPSKVFDYFLLELFVTLFNESCTASVFITFRRDLSNFHIDAHPVCQVLMDMVASSEKHRATIYVKRAHLAKFWERWVASLNTPFLAVLAQMNSNTSENYLLNPLLADLVPSNRFPSAEIAATPQNENDDGAQPKNVLFCSKVDDQKLAAFRSLSWKYVQDVMRETETGICRDCQRVFCVSPHVIDKRYRAFLDASNRLKNTRCATGQPQQSATCAPVATTYLRKKRQKQKNNRYTFAPESTIRWACCDRCGLWRTLPGCSSAEYEALQKLRYWTCSMNRWDPAQALCFAEQAQRDNSQQLSSNRLFWVQCVDCRKWRAVPQCSSEMHGLFQDTSRWVCSMNSWDPLHASCSSQENVELYSCENFFHISLSDKTYPSSEESLFSSPCLSSPTNSPSCTVSPLTEPKAKLQCLYEPPEKFSVSSDQSWHLSNSLFLPSAIVTSYRQALQQQFTQFVVATKNETSAALSLTSYTLNENVEHAANAYRDSVANKKLVAFLKQDTPNWLVAQDATQVTERHQPLAPELLHRMVSRCASPLLQKLESTHLELALWLTKRKQSRKRNPSRPSTTIANECLSVPQKTQLFQHMATALDIRWKIELEEQKRLQEEYKWCVCASGKRRQRYKLPLLRPSLHAMHDAA